MDEMLLTRLGNGSLEDGIDRALTELDKAGYQFRPGGQGYIAPDGSHVMIFARLPLWMQVAKAYKNMQDLRELNLI